MRSYQSYSIKIRKKVDWQQSSWKARNYSACWIFNPVREIDSRRTRCSSNHFLSVVCKIPRWWPWWASGSADWAKAILEQNTARCARTSAWYGSGSSWVITASDRLAYHWWAWIFHLRIECLPYSQAIWSHPTSSFWDCNRFEWIRSKNKSG